MAATMNIANRKAANIDLSSHIEDFHHILGHSLPFKSFHQPEDRHLDRQRRFIDQSCLSKEEASANLPMVKVPFFELP
jgi:hypothetical protein